MRIFDANTHIEKNPLSIRLKELNSWHEEADEGSITHYATVQDIIYGMKKHEITRSLVMPNSVTPDKEEAKKANVIIAREIAGYQGLVGAATVHPYSKTAIYDLEEAILENGLSALTLSPDRQGYELNDEALWMLLERVEEIGTTVILHTLWSKDASEYFNLKELFDVGSSFHINFILTHMGAGDEISPLSEVAELEKILALEIGKKDLERIMGKNLEALLK